jgi:hypothetical protein
VLTIPRMNTSSPVIPDLEVELADANTLSLAVR